jgi:ABC-type transport system involved in cytochrome bd biosynthesis fused ATPase/permease subunit
LDEATSNLDSESELLIQDGLRTLRSGRTTFVIAHRLATVRIAEQIVVLDDGAIIERGSHEELLMQEGRYWQLYQAQYRRERDALADRRLKQSGPLRRNADRDGLDRVREHRNER